MDLQSQMLAMSRKSAGNIRQTEATADELFRYMPTKDGQTRSRMFSKSYILAEIPLASVAVVESRRTFELMASKETSDAPIVVDINKKRLGASPGGYVPKVIVVEGSSRYGRARHAGRQSILAWVGASAVKVLSLSEGDKDLQDKLQKALTSCDCVDASARVREVYPYEKAFMFSLDGESYRQRFDVSASGVELLGNALKISRKMIATPGSKIDATMKIFAGAGSSGTAGPGGASTQAGDVNLTNPSLNACKACAKDAVMAKAIKDYKKAVAAGWRPKDDMMSKAAPGWEHSVKKMKSHPEIDNPWALSHWMDDQGYKPGGKKKDDVAAVAPTAEGGLSRGAGPAARMATPMANPGSTAHVSSPSPSVQSPGSGVGPRVVPGPTAIMRGARGMVKKIVTKNHKAHKNLLARV